MRGKRLMFYFSILGIGGLIKDLFKGMNSVHVTCTEYVYAVNVSLMIYSSFVLEMPQILKRTII